MFCYRACDVYLLQLDLAAEATEKRKQLEIEKEITPDLVHKYKVIHCLVCGYNGSHDQTQVAKEQAISESTQGTSIYWL